MPPDVRGVFHRERLGGEGAVGCGEERRVNRRVAGGVDLARREAAAQLTERRALRELVWKEVDLSARRLDAKARPRLALFRHRLRVHAVGAVDEEVRVVDDAAADERAITQIERVTARDLLSCRGDQSVMRLAPRGIDLAVLQKHRAVRRHGVFGRCAFRPLDAPILLDRARRHGNQLHFLRDFAQTLDGERRHEAVRLALDMLDANIALALVTARVEQRVVEVGSEYDVFHFSCRRASV